MKLYLLKRNMIYYICDCPKDIKIPTNDFEAYPYYKDYTYLYNKKWVADSQNVGCGTNRQVPNKFPVIVRPMINLYGMGKGTYYVTNYEQSSKISNKDFWEEILHGNHVSVDVFKNDHGILGTVAFLGIPADLFKFIYWEYLPDYQLPLKVTQWISKNMKSFIGVFNLELIGDKIIECHLRMGDLNYFQNEELINNVILCHLNRHIELPKLDKIYLVPVFVKSGHYQRLQKEEILKYARRFGSDKLLNYLIDPSPSTIANPPGGDRICNLTVSDLNTGIKIRDCILKSLNNNRL